MDRRRFLAAGLAGLGAATAGCSGVLGETVTLADPETGTNDEGAEKYFTYRHDGERQAVLGVDQQSPQASPTDGFPLRLSVSHRDGLGADDPGTTIERLRFELRAPPTSVGPPAEVYLATPGGSIWPELTFRTTDDSWTVIAADGLGGDGPGQGTLTLATRIEPVGTPVDELALRADLTLSGRGRTYEIDERVRFEPVRAD